MESILDREASPTCSKNNPQLWARGNFVTTWLNEVTENGKRIPSISPATALVTRKWVNGNELGEPQLSQFPKGRKEGLLKIIDPNLTIPTFSMSLSKEGVAIMMILYAGFFLEDRWETEFRYFHSQLKKMNTPVLARRLKYL